MDGKPVERHVYVRIVIGRLMGDCDVDAHASVQQGIGDIPMVVAEIPGGVLAEPHDVSRANHDRDSKKDKLARLKARQL